MCVLFCYHLLTGMLYIATMVLQLVLKGIIHITYQEKYNFKQKVKVKVRSHKVTDSKMFTNVMQHMFYGLFCT